MSSPPPHENTTIPQRRRFLLNTIIISPAASHTAFHKSPTETLNSAAEVEKGFIMESLPVQFCRNIRLMWRRRRYQRIEGASLGGRKGLRIVKLGGGSGGGAPRRTWKLGRAPRLRVRLLSPLRLLARVRDAYISAMLRLAGKSGGLSGFAAPDAFWAKRVPKARPVTPAPLDFETRILVEIYKSFLAPNELAAL